jgi:Flp pilus assembly secretin CpaC
LVLLAPQGRPLRAGDTCPLPPSPSPGASGGQIQIDAVLIKARRGLTRGVIDHFLGAQHQAGSPGIPDGSPTDLQFGVINNRSGLLDVLDVLRKAHLLKLIAEPRLITTSGRPGCFLVGGEQAVPVVGKKGQVGVQFEEFGTRVNSTPTLLGNGKIRLEVEPEVSEINPASGTHIAGTFVPGRTTNRVHTTVDLESGQTYVIGGLIQDQEELIVLVSPSVVRPSSCDHAAEACSPEEPSRPASSPHGQATAELSHKEAAERLRRMEGRLQRLRQEVDDIRQEIHTLHEAVPLSADR